MSAQEVNVPFVPRNGIDKSNMIKFMRIFGLRNSAINMGVREEVFSNIDLDSSEKNYLYNIASGLQSGVYAADNNLPMNDDIFSEALANADPTTSYFSEEGI